MYGFRAIVWNRKRVAGFFLLQTPCTAGVSLIGPGAAFAGVSGVPWVGGGTPGLIKGNMALPPGRKKTENGRKVYSQSARAVQYRKAMGVGEFAETAAADTPPPITTVETPPETRLPQEGLSTESIGVETTVTVRELVTAPEDEAPSYFCENCKGKVAVGDPECSTCEENLNWSGLT